MAASINCYPIMRNSNEVHIQTSRPSATSGKSVLNPPATRKYGSIVEVRAAARKATVHIKRLCRRPPTVHIKRLLIMHSLDRKRCLESSSLVPVQYMPKRRLVAAVCTGPK
eukprot:jgi/Ulvmu1/11914/UM081_0074.1